MVNQSFKEKLNKEIIEKENPSIQYYLIKQNYATLKNDLIYIDDYIDTEFIKKAQKLEIFRGLMQYIEEFTLYFLSILKEQDISIFLIKTWNKEINNFYYTAVNEPRELLSNYNYNNFNELFNNVFKCNDKKSLLNINTVMYNISYFWNNYKDMYNSIKHGYRFFKKDITHFSIENEELIPIDEEYIEVICKVDSNPYSLIYPINYLLELSMAILEDVNNIFNFLLRSNQFMEEKLFNYTSKTNLLNNYVKVYNGEVSLFLPNNPNLGDKINKGGIYKFCHFSLNNNKLSVFINDSNSIDYPFGVIFKLSKNNHNFPFSYVSEIYLINSIWFDVSQAYILKIVNKIQRNNNFKYEFINDSSLKPENNMVFKIDDEIINFPEDILEKLIKLEKILEIDIPTPFNLTDIQKTELSNFNPSSLTRKECNEFLINLKNQNIDKLKIYLVFNKEDNVIEKYLGYTFDLDFFKIGEKNIKEVGKNFSVNFCCNPEMNLFEIFVNMQEKLIDGESLDLLNFSNINNIHFYTGYMEVFWFNEYKLTFVVDL